MSILAQIHNPAYWKYLALTTAILVFLNFVFLSDAGTVLKHMIADSQSPAQPNDNATKQDEYVAVCLSVRDQADDLVEFFVHHYHHMGIRRFYVMDDGSEPPLSSYEYPGIPHSALTFTWQDPAQRDEHMQMQFYNWCIERYSQSHQWIAFIDADEFLDTPGNESLTEILATMDKNETVGALGVK